MIYDNLELVLGKAGRRLTKRFKSETVDQSKGISVSGKPEYFKNVASAMAFIVQRHKKDDMAESQVQIYYRDEREYPWQPVFDIMPAIEPDPKSRKRYRNRNKIRMGWNYIISGWMFIRFADARDYEK